MFRVSATIRPFLIAALAAFFAGSFSAGPFAADRQKPKVTKVKPKPADNNADAEASAEPDKLLYERGLKSVKRGKHIEARLAFQTLINSYPDSEYLAKAKLGAADSYYKEGGASGLTQAIDEYKNFIVFFPFLDEASYAQMQVGMAHYRMMQKSDRDTAHAQAAEDELQAFLTKYPQSPLVPEAEQRLREVQEVLAESDFGVGRFYYIRGNYRASAARLLEVTERYPLYSESDHALFLLGDVYMRARQASMNEDDRNHWVDLSAQCYERILREYPLSKYAPDATAQLKTLGRPIPTPNLLAMAQARAQQAYRKEHHPNVILKIPLAMIKSSPDVSAAARSGKPNLTPADDSFSAMDVLKPGPGGLTTTLAAVGFQAAGGSSVGDTSPGEQPAAPAEQTTQGATTESSAAAATLATPLPEPPPAPHASQGAADDNSQAGAQQTAAKADSKTESTSKKKKGFHKLVPW